jgi:hypothetical protein
MSDVTRPLEETPTVILRELEAQKSKVSQHFRDIEDRVATKEWDKALQKINHLAGMNEVVDAIFHAGG